MEGGGRTETGSEEEEEECSLTDICVFESVHVSQHRKDPCTVLEGKHSGKCSNTLTEASQEEEAQDLDLDYDSVWSKVLVAALDLLSDVVLLHLTGLHL